MSICFKHVNKRYSPISPFVLENINLDICTGEFFIFLGESGSGKTTLLKMINGLTLPTDGTVTVDGVDISRCNLTNLRRTIGYCVQGSMLFPNMTAQENIAFVPNLIKQQHQGEYVDLTCSLAQKVKFPLELLNRYPRELSGGQQQRIAIARALAANGSILLADEPFSALDPIVRRELQNLILELHRDNHYTTVMVTHNIAEAMKLADRICIIHDHHIAQIGTPKEIMENPATNYVRRLTEEEKILTTP